MLRSALVLVLCCLVAGCATIKSASSTPRSTIINAPVDVVWQSIIKEVGIDYPIESIEKESGLLTTTFVSIGAGFLNKSMAQWVLNPECFLCTWNGLRLKMNIMVDGNSPSSTNVTIRAHYEGYENNVSKQWIPLASNGSLEEDIFTRIRARSQTRR